MHAGHRSAERCPTQPLWYRWPPRDLYRTNANVAFTCYVAGVIGCVCGAGRGPHPWWCPSGHSCVTTFSGFVLRGRFPRNKLRHGHSRDAWATEVAAGWCPAARHRDPDSAAAEFPDTCARDWEAVWVGVRGRAPPGEAARARVVHTWPCIAARSSEQASFTARGHARCSRQ